MEVVQLENIKECKPVIINMKALADTILLRMDSDYSDYKTFEFECANGLHIEIEALYRGFNYRNIQLLHVYVMDKDLKSFTDYENDLSGYLIDGIADLNCESEKKFYDNTNMFD